MEKLEKFQEFLKSNLVELRVFCRYGGRCKASNETFRKYWQFSSTFLLVRNGETLYASCCGT